MFERQLAELAKGKAESMPILMQMLQASRDTYGDLARQQELSQEQQRVYLSGGQRAAQQAAEDANRAAMDQAVAASMGSGRFGSVLANQMRAGLAQQAGRSNIQTSAMFGDKMAGLEAQQQANRLNLAQSGLAAEQGIQGNIVNMLMATSGARAGAMGDVQYQTAPQGPNIFTSMMAAAGQAGGWNNLFGGIDSAVSGLFGGNKGATSGLPEYAIDPNE